jgi:hypothetical protein
MSDRDSFIGFDAGSTPPRTSLTAVTMNGNDTAGGGPHAGLMIQPSARTWPSVRGAHAAAKLKTSKGWKNFRRREY